MSYLMNFPAITAVISAFMMDAVVHAAAVVSAAASLMLGPVVDTETKHINIEQQNIEQQRDATSAMRLFTVGAQF